MEFQSDREKEEFMHSISCGAVIAVGFVFALGGAASWGAGPPNNDVSDEAGNTAGGTNALANKGQQEGR